MFIDCHFQGDSGLIIPRNQKGYSIQSVVTEFIVGVLIYFPLPTDFFFFFTTRCCFPPERFPPLFLTCVQWLRGFYNF